MSERYTYFDHEADIGIIARGSTLEHAFEATAEAMFAIMIPSDEVHPLQTIQIQFDEMDSEIALVTWLNQLLGKAQLQGLKLCRFHLIREDSQWFGEAWGEPWEENSERGVEVKGATFTELSVKQTSQEWVVRCVVDV